MNRHLQSQSGRSHIGILNGIIFGFHKMKLYVYGFSILLKPNRLFHPYYFEAMFVFEMTESIGEEVSTILCPRDVQGANGFRMDEVTHKMP